MTNTALSRNCLYGVRNERGEWLGLREQYEDPQSYRLEYSFFESIIEALATGDIEEARGWAADHGGTVVEFIQS